MKRKIELLAPGGDIDSIKAAIVAGADAVYCGLNKFNARNRATNINVEDLPGIIRLAHTNNCKIYITLNIIVVDNEIPALIRLLNKLVNVNIDGVIIQDLGLLYIVSSYFKRFNIHASTQLTTHNSGQIEFLSTFNTTQVNLSRELNIREIKTLALIGHQNNMLSEVFVHGSSCICFSGACYMSSVQGGNSGNRGRCSQPCRDQYLTTSAGVNFPLNIKDNSAYFDLKELADSGIDSVKIEGRIKKFHYVYTVVDAWKKHLQQLYDGSKLSNDNSALYKVFNRDFSNSFLKGEISKDMFIDYPRDHSAIHISEEMDGDFEESLEKSKGDVYNERTDIIKSVEQKISLLSVSKAPLFIHISGKNECPLKINIQTSDTSFELISETNLKNTGNQSLNYVTFIARFKAINETEYYIEHINLEDFEPNLFLPFKELTALKKRILFILNGLKEMVDPIELPSFKKFEIENREPNLSVLISSQKDIPLCLETSANIYFELPNNFNKVYSEYVDLFLLNTSLIPWFPSILIGDDYKAAVKFLELVRPKCIVTNNTGIAYHAFKIGIRWIAGPHLNIVNTYSLLCLKEKFNCSGSFISNEISKSQLNSVKTLENFELFYSIYHPIVLMTSRQCLFHQVTGCEKNKIDNKCIEQCEMRSSIRNLKDVSFIIEKSKGNFHTIYNEINYLNTAVVRDFKNKFSTFLIDLRDIKTKTKVEIDKKSVINHFENLLKNNSESETKIHQHIFPTTNSQYKIGI
ncbi:MAG: peptidase U32 family protein [Bacteroidota bacterium]